MLALLKRNFILYFRNRPLYHFFAEELDGCLVPTP